MTQDNIFDYIEIDYSKNDISEFDKKVKKIGNHRIFKCYTYLTKFFDKDKKSSIDVNEDLKYYLTQIEDTHYFKTINGLINKEKDKGVTAAAAAAAGGKRGKYSIIRKKKFSRRFGIKKSSKRINHKKFSKRLNKKIKGGNSSHNIIVIFIFSLIRFSITNPITNPSPAPTRSRVNVERVSQDAFSPTRHQTSRHNSNIVDFNLLFYIQKPNVNMCLFVGKAYINNLDSFEGDDVLISKFLKLSTDLLIFTTDYFSNPPISYAIRSNNKTKTCIRTISSSDRPDSENVDKFVDFCRYADELLPDPYHITCYDDNDNIIDTIPPNFLDGNGIIYIIFGILIYSFVAADISVQGVQGSFTCCIPRFMYRLILHTIDYFLLPPNLRDNDDGDTIAETNSEDSEHERDLEFAAVVNDDMSQVYQSLPRVNPGASLLDLPIDSITRGNPGASSLYQPIDSRTRGNPGALLDQQIDPATRVNPDMLNAPVNLTVINRELLPPPPPLPPTT